VELVEIAGVRKTKMGSPEVFAGNVNILAVANHKKVIIRRWISLQEDVVAFWMKTLSEKSREYLVPFAAEWVPGAEIVFF